MDGVIPVLKPSGMTSHDVVFKLRKILKTKRVGHTGTLDPDVTGVLPIAVNQGTKLVEYLQERDKRYLATVALGFSTTTEDASGEIVECSQVSHISDEEIILVINSFLGRYKQQVPKFSAVKVRGKRLYEYAREGIEVERPIRDVHIKKLDLISSIRHENNIIEFDIDVRCTKGTYIRTLAVDIGKKLNVEAHMKSLKRIESCGFLLQDAIEIDNITIESVVPIENILNNEYSIDITNDEALKFKVCNGQIIDNIHILDNLNTSKKGLKSVVFIHDNQVIAFYRQIDIDKNGLKPYKMFLNREGG